MDAMNPTMTPDEMDTVLTGLSEEERHYLRHIITRVMMCFSKADEHVVMCFGNSSEERISICTVNCEEMTAANIIEQAHDVMDFTNTHDAPPKEMFN